MQLGLSHVILDVLGPGESNCKLPNSDILCMFAQFSHTWVAPVHLCQLPSTFLAWPSLQHATNGGEASVTLVSLVLPLRFAAFSYS